MHTYAVTKLARQKAILDLVRSHPVASQEELRHALRRRGSRVTQATLSRDIHELKLVKTEAGYAAVSGEPPPDPGLPPVERLVREFVAEVRPAQNLLVLKTALGSAQPVAAAIDKEAWPEIVGTIGGDDAILIVCADRKAARQLAQRLQEMLA
ncbi:MAG: arginine repressor [Terriglobales bacterium]